MSHRIIRPEAADGFKRGRLDRRSFLLGFAASASALSLAGCVTNDGGMSLAEAEKHYGAVPDKKFPISAVDVSQVDPKYFRRTVNYESDEAPGTIIVDNANYFVYRIEGEGKATRYGANVGRQGFLWHGEAYIGHVTRPDADRRDSGNARRALRLGAKLRDIRLARMVPQLGEVEQRDGAPGERDLSFGAHGPASSKPVIMRIIAALPLAATVFVS